ncbi:MAG: NAD(P)H-binding protein [Clostridiales bacterium]|jgi:putative NADH-flavin reductase|nr:NAD(P)H-binding protein [Clostridiales bacterium]
MTKKIAIISATGKVGRLIAAEAFDRGFDVTAIVRDARKVDTNRYAVLERDIMDVTADDAANFDAVVSAYGRGPRQGIHAPNEPRLPDRGI